MPPTPPPPPPSRRSIIVQHARRLFFVRPMSVASTRTPGSGTFIPLVICALLGLATEIYFITLFGAKVLTRPYFWPGLLLSAFWVYCLIVRSFRLWHLYVWRFASIWSGAWTVCGVLFTINPLFALIIPFPAWPWLEETGVHPYLALLLHGLIWACSADVLRSVQSKA